MTLIGAEILKLRRRRGLMIWSAVLTIGPVLVAYGVLLGLHAFSPDKHGPAGGVSNLDGLLGVVVVLGGIAATIIGTTAGSQDASSGVFRDLVVTGRPRTALFRARTPGALAVFLPLYAASFALAVAGSYAFAGGLPTPSAHRVVQYAEWAAATGVLSVVLAVALGSIVSGRIAVGVLIAWNTVVSGLLVTIGALGSARQAVPDAAAEHFAPSVEGATRVAMSTGTALLVLALWAAVALRAGAVWTKRRDA
jgi:ABC-2 type transport system permease protein